MMRVRYHHGLKGGDELVSKQDYNFQLLLVLLAVMLGITGLASLGAMIMFLTAFM